ncbi:MAG: helix-turn-helix domain-containing protein [Chloroflexi bacterium]|nr:helix-turn-helix domain-containing protein [Chloroflexota bacterium]
MSQPEPVQELLSLKQVEQRYGVKRSTLYRYIQKGDISTYRRAMDKRVYVRKKDIEELRRFRAAERQGKLTLAAVERARAFQLRVFGERRLTTSSADLVEETRRERTEELP